MITLDSRARRLYSMNENTVVKLISRTAVWLVDVVDDCDGFDNLDIGGGQ